ncbi:DMT family transporter [Reinekea sp.]|jgi:transporter family-2 protein|uniref:DMT family transporter n=1 Tax=Reinekea sp. TaxID=1970455 RepID=UPI00398944B5
MMLVMLGLLNGVLISLARIINGRLSSYKGAFYSSWINHLGGFVLLTFLLFAVQGMPIAIGSIPSYLFLGGIIGGLYVGLNSFVVIRIGVTMSTLLVISGQLIVSVFIDMWLGKVTLAIDLPTGLIFLGCLMVIVGFYIMSDR